MRSRTERVQSMAELIIAVCIGDKGKDENYSMSSESELIEDVVHVMDMLNIRLEKELNVSFNSISDGTPSPEDDVSYDSNDFKTYSNLTVVEGRIRLQPDIKRNIRALLQWYKHQFILGLNPADEPFPVGDAIKARTNTKEFHIQVSYNS